ncbi:hemerythrin domain-containing protein [Variovorax sp. IB41]|uniref:hemerythrin domain-containing protein n=1 Tax=Variovorax sp. IB41 TaxID=2779370 RepID=UPI001E63A811|nr:hemerythrin domain-containing protein [Variovorax sp. IB41]
MTSPIQPRFDIYSSIHKALRALMADTLFKLGRMDPDDPQDVARTARDVRRLLDVCRAHADHENRFIHPLLEVHAPGASRAVVYEHADHDEEAGRIGAAAAGLATCHAGQRTLAAAALYRSLALFIASNFEHQHLEETVHNAVLWTHCTDAEIMNLHHALTESIAPEELLFILRWLVPAMPPAERTATMRNLRRAAPAAFQAAMDMLQAHLSDGEWSRLLQGLAQEDPQGVEA